ncbi:MAG: endonuclease MutS2, partial [Calditrichaeota bacterium]
LVDIGDRQSLEQDLSTFSAHIVRLKEILEQADSHSLVLIDEIGTGTDPREGSALAIALLSELTDRNVLTIATTHHGELKAFAHSHPRVENASMEFDLTTLQPTYRLRVGVPGSSYAFEIARRYGLPDALIEKGRQLVGEQKDRLERLLLDLEQRIQQLDRERRELSIKLSEAEATRKLYENRLEELKKRGAELKRQAAEEAQQILRRANALIEQAVREIRESQASREAIKTARETIREQKQELENILKATGEPVTPSPPTFLRKGDTVIVESLGEKGELLEDTRGKSKVRVLVGNVKLTVDITGLRRADGEPAESSPVHKMTGSRVDAVGPGVGPELDLRGLDAEQAIEETDRYLDQALEQGWEEVRIIHGKGTGVLRRRVNEFLSRDKRVLQKRLGKWGEGDTGVTVVKLRRE